MLCANERAAAERLGFVHPSRVHDMLPHASYIMCSDDCVAAVALRPLGRVETGARALLFPSIRFDRKERRGACTLVAPPSGLPDPPAPVSCSHAQQLALLNNIGKEPSTGLDAASGSVRCLQHHTIVPTQESVKKRFQDRQIELPAGHAKFTMLPASGGLNVLRLGQLPLRCRFDSAPAPVRVRLGRR
jgi:hypothetical protein